MGYELDGPGFDSWRGIQTSSKVHLAYYEREADHLPPYSAEVKNGGSIPPLPPCLHGTARNSLIRRIDIHLSYAFHRMYRISSLAEQLLASQEGFCSMELIDFSLCVCVCERERERDVNVSGTWYTADCSYLLRVCVGFSLTFTKLVINYLSYLLTFPCERYMERYFWKNFCLKDCSEYAEKKNLLRLKNYVSKLQIKILPIFYKMVNTENKSQRSVKCYTNE
jgi:hypothetical protein